VIVGVIVGVIVVVGVSVGVIEGVGVIVGERYCVGVTEGVKVMVGVMLGVGGGNALMAMVKLSPQMKLLQLPAIAENVLTLVLLPPKPNYRHC